MTNSPPFRLVYGDVEVPDYSTSHDAMDQTIRAWHLPGVEDNEHGNWDREIGPDAHDQAKAWAKRRIESATEYAVVDWVDQTDQDTTSPRYLATVVRLQHTLTVTLGTGEQLLHLCDTAAEAQHAVDDVRDGTGVVALPHRPGPGQHSNVTYLPVGSVARVDHVVTRHPVPGTLDDVVWLLAQQGYGCTPMCQDPGRDRVTDLVITVVAGPGGTEPTDELLDAAPGHVRAVLDAHGWTDVRAAWVTEGYSRAGSDSP